MTLRERLSSGHTAYILFPEGTRTRTGKLGRFKPGLGMLVAESKVPVVPCYIDGAFAALPPDRRFPRPRRIVIRVGSPLAFENVRNNSAGWKEVTALVEQAVVALDSENR